MAEIAQIARRGFHERGRPADKNARRAPWRNPAVANMARSMRRDCPANRPVSPPSAYAPQSNRRRRRRRRGDPILRDRLYQPNRAKWAGRSSFVPWNGVESVARGDSKDNTPKVRYAGLYK